MEDLLGIPLESLATSLPLAGLIGLYLALDGLAGKEADVGKDYHALLDQALDERQEATQRAARDWPAVGNPTGEVTLPGLARRLWKRLGEIDEKERKLRAKMRRYRWLRRCARYAIGLGVITCTIGFFWGEGRLYLTALAVLIFVGTLLAALYARQIGSGIDAFGDDAMFRRPSS